MRVEGDDKYDEDPQLAEEAYNQEVARLINEGLKCPTCDAPPREIMTIENGVASMIACRRGHDWYLDSTREDDGTSDT